MKNLIGILPCILLAGCASLDKTIEALGTAATTTLSIEAAQEAAEAEMIADFRKKSDQLRFLSAGTYSCGDPGNANIIAIEGRGTAATKQFEATVSSLHKAQLATLDSFIDYAKGIDAAIKRSKEAADALKAASDSLKLAADATGDPAITTSANVVLKGAELIRQGAEYVVISDMARKAHPGLIAAAAYLKKNGGLLRLREQGRFVFNYWNACALERLRFIRGCFPTVPSGCGDKPPAISQFRWAKGMTQSPVVEVGREYAAYVAERDAYIAKLPNAEAVMNALIKANESLFKTYDGRDIAAWSDFNAAARALYDFRDAYQAATN